MDIMTEAKVLKHMLTREVVSLDVDGFTSPQEVIEYSGRLLEKAGKVTEQYVKDMVSAYETLGPYIVMAPGLAMPHARPGGNVKENAVSFVKLKNPMKFNNANNDPVKIVIALAGVSDNGHIDILQDLSSLLGEPDVIERLSQVSSYEELINIIEKEESR